MICIRNARFWVYEGAGWVKLTLRPGQSLTYSHGGPTDEGWYRDSTTWTHEGERVVREWCNEARDCDGRMDRAGEDSCELDALRDELRTVEPPLRSMGEDVLFVPAWDETDRSQRDYQAELAGY